mmetsp:Transcript_58822/g.120347  ORF Transcript_58822/g.120347 Transcript_58822/m.120347 type:complete len:264 (-) Transcript_58822:60-851(-)
MTPTITAQDTIVLWSETAAVVHTDEEEASMLQQAKELVASAPAKQSFLGVTYSLRKVGEEADNVFALIAPDGQLAWKYIKSHPVPFVEAGVRAGPSVLPTYDDERLGRMGGAICFDLDYDNFLLQAGMKGVSLLLQPSWTWSAIYARHFDGNALRAVENGATLLRCSSDGESGVVSPHGLVLHREVTLHDPSIPVVFSVPLAPRVWTPYAHGGYIFQYLVTAASVIAWLMVLLPSSARRLPVIKFLYCNPQSLAGHNSRARPL